MSQKRLKPAAEVSTRSWTTMRSGGNQTVERLTWVAQVEQRGVAGALCFVYTLCMPTKTISVRLEAYEKLKRARRYDGESFSEVVLRARWPEETITAEQLATRYREEGPFFAEEEIARIERLKRDEGPPEDKWADR